MIKLKQEITTLIGELNHWKEKAIELESKRAYWEKRFKDLEDGKA